LSVGASIQIAVDVLDIRHRKITYVTIHGRQPKINRSPSRIGELSIRKEHLLESR
jgi:hypothetical protein